MLRLFELLNERVLHGHWASWAGSDSEVCMSVFEQMKERIGERTLELWGDLFVSVYGKRWNWWANWWAKRCFTCELVSESRVGAWICDPFNLRDWATCCEVWSHILGLFGIFWEISLDKVPGYVWTNCRCKWAYLARIEGWEHLRCDPFKILSSFAARLGSSFSSRFEL